MRMAAAKTRSAGYRMMIFSDVNVRFDLVYCVGRGPGGRLWWSFNMEIRGTSFIDF